MNAVLSYALYIKFLSLTALLESMNSYEYESFIGALNLTLNVLLESIDVLLCSHKLAS